MRIAGLLLVMLIIVNGVMLQPEARKTAAETPAQQEFTIFAQNGRIPVMVCGRFAESFTRDRNQVNFIEQGQSGILQI